METNFFIASRLAKIKLLPDEPGRIQKHFILTKGQHQGFYNYCLHWKLAPWMYSQIIRNNLERAIDENVMLQFEAIHRKTQLENESRNQAALSFLKEFENQNIDCVVLKGNLFIHTVYNDLGYKKMNDFDMLIQPDDWWKVQKIYQDLNYIPLGFGWGGEKGKVAKFSHAGLSYISPDYKCITGTQWGLKSPTSAYKIDYKPIWDSSRPFNFYGIELSQLSPEYNLMHLIWHMGTYKIGIRDCMDIYNLLLATPDFDEDHLVEICRQTRTTDKAWFTLNLTNVCSDAVSPGLLQKLKCNPKSFIVNRLNSRLIMDRNTGDFQLSYNDFFHDVEMQVFYFSLFHLFHQKIVFYGRLAKTMLWPSKELALKFCDMQPDASTLNQIKARLKAPYFSFKLIGEEIGTLVTILLFIKMLFDILIAIPNYIFRKDNYFIYLEKRGIKKEDIQRAVKNIQ